MNFRTVKIGTRLGIGFGIILALLVCVLSADIVISANVRNTQNEGMKRANAKAVQANAMRGAILEGGIAARNVGLQYTTPDIEREAAKAKEQRKRFQEAQDKLLALGLNAEEKALVASIVEIDRQTEAPFQDAIQKVKEYANEAAGKLISSSIDPLNQKAIAEIDKLVNIQQKAVDQLIAASEASGKQMTTILGLTAVFSVLIGTILSIFTTRSITRHPRDA